MTDLTNIINAAASVRLGSGDFTQDGSSGFFKTAKGHIDTICKVSEVVATRSGITVPSEIAEIKKLLRRPLAASKFSTGSGGGTDRVYIAIRSLVRRLFVIEELSGSLGIVIPTQDIAKLDRVLFSNNQKIGSLEIGERVDGFQTIIIMLRLLDRSTLQILRALRELAPDVETTTYDVSGVWAQSIAPEPIQFIDGGITDFGPGLGELPDQAITITITNTGASPLIFGAPIPIAVTGTTLTGGVGAVNITQPVDFSVNPGDSIEATMAMAFAAPDLGQVRDIDLQINTDNGDPITLTTTVRLTIVGMDPV